VLEIVGDEGELVMQRYGRNGHVCGGQGNALLAVVALNQTGQAGHGPGGGIVTQGLQKFLGARFFSRTHAGVDFGYVDGTAGQDIAFRAIAP